MPTLAPHRSERARLTHPAPHTMVSLRERVLPQHYATPGSGCRHTWPAGFAAALGSGNVDRGPATPHSACVGGGAVPHDFKMHLSIPSSTQIKACPQIHSFCRIQSHPSDNWPFGQKPPPLVFPLQVCLNSGLNRVTLLTEVPQKLRERQDRNPITLARTETRRT